MVALRGSLRMEEPEQAPLSIAGLVNFGKTCFANALLQALASCPAIVQYVEMLFRTLTWSRVVVPYGNGRVGTPLIQALNEALIRLQPRTGFHDLTGTASSLAVLHAMVAHKEAVFCQWDLQQDVAEALESVLSVLQAEVDSWLRLQSRPLTFSSRLQCRIPSLVDFPHWNPILEVPIIKNTMAGPNTVAPDDMGDLQMHLSREQGPCNGLLANCLHCKSCGHRYSTMLTKFSTLLLHVPAAANRLVGPRGPQITRLEDCLRVYCAEREVGPVLCPHCSLLTTIDRALRKQHGSNCHDVPCCNEPALSTKQVTWFGRIAGWLGWKAPQGLKPGPPAPPLTSDSGCVLQSHGLADLLEDDWEKSSSNGSLARAQSPGCSQVSSSAWSALELSPSTQDLWKLVFESSNTAAARNSCVYSTGSQSPTPSCTSREVPTPVSPDSWGGWLGAYGVNKGVVESSQTASQCSAAYRLDPTFNVKDFETECWKQPIGKGLPLGSDVIAKVMDALRSCSILQDSTIQAYREELEDVNISWQEEESTAISKTRFGRLPEVLPIVLQKEALATSDSEKAEGRLAIPKILDMSNFVYMHQPKGAIYHLMAMVIHVGDDTSGHYLTARRVSLSETESVWFLAFDEQIQQVAEEDVLGLDPCMLLYEREMWY